MKRLTTTFVFALMAIMACGQEWKIMPYGGEIVNFFEGQEYHLILCAGKNLAIITSKEGFFEDYGTGIVKAHIGFYESGVLINEKEISMDISSEWDACYIRQKKLLKQIRKHLKETGAIRITIPRFETDELTLILPHFPDLVE